MKANNAQTKGNGQLVSAALMLGFFSLGSRVVGLIRERLLATTFGASDSFDAFVAAFRLPDLIFNLIVVGALSAAFIPLFTEKLVQAKGKNSQPFTFALSVLNSLAVATAIISLLYALFAPSLVPLMTPGFNQEKLALTIRLSRIMALQPPLLAISFVLSGILNSYKRFFVYALAPILYNLGIIFGIVFLVPRWGVVGAGYGVVIGAALHMLVQLPSVWALGVRWRPIFNWGSSDIRRLWRMMVPRVVALGAQQVNLFVVTIFGSGLMAGSISAFYLANNVQYLPIGIFGIAFAQAAFPALAEYNARNQRKVLLNTLTTSFRYILFFIIPISVFFFLLRAQIIRVLFGDGAFDWQDTIVTYEIFAWLIVSIFAQATIPLLTRAFYAWHDARTPVTIIVIGEITNIGLAAYLAPRYGIQGLAMALSFSNILSFMLLLARLHWQFNGFNDREVLLSLVRFAVAAMVAGLMLQILKYPVAAVVNMRRFWGVFTQLVVAGGGGVLTYLVFCWFLKCEELVVLRKYFPRKLKTLPQNAETARFVDLSDS
jgi:putative peptidoglycan lipid II flippase